MQKMGITRCRDGARATSPARTGLIALVLVIGCAARLSAQTPPATCAAAPPGKLAANTAGQVTVETLPAMTALVLPVVGSFEQTPQALARLMAYAMPKGIMRGAPFGLYYDDPSKVAADSLHWEIGVPVPEGTPAEAPFVVRAMPAIEAAVLLCTGPFEGTAPCYGVLAKWVQTNGYAVVIPIQEHWLSDPRTVAPEQFQTRLVFPIVRGGKP
jgi:effector-binding domain-containing protein